MTRLNFHRIFLEVFEDFYYELLRQKEKALRMSEIEYIKDSAVYETVSSKNQLLVDDIQNHFLSFFEQQNLLYAGHIGINPSHIRESQYLMVILTDEIFLNIKWSGVQCWKQSLLETRIFHTQIAGEAFFEQLDRLLTSRDPSRFDLVCLYFYVLTLGFRGKYRNQDDKRQIRWYIEELHTLSSYHIPEFSRSKRSKIIHQCYEHTLNETPGRGLPDVRLWVTGIVSVVLVYIFVTYVAWYKLASEIHEALQGIHFSFKESSIL
jgi:type VI secretion system protein ImpK